ncbi:MAG: sortase [Actinomycetota bacterium]
MQDATSPTGTDAGAGVPRRAFGLRRLLRILGTLCLAVAFGIAGYIGWLLWGTGLATQRWQSAHRAGFEKAINTKRPTDPDAVKVRLPGTAVAILKIPGISLDIIVVEGTDSADLVKGPGHYTDTAYPWQDHGRVGIAGHRTTYLHPFFHLDQVRVGDPIVLETEYGTFRYAVTRVFSIPTAGSGVVLHQTGEPTLVLTTCDPPYSASRRLIVTADRV